MLGRPLQAMPSADGVVVQQQHPRDRLAAHALVQQHQRVRASRQTMRGRPVPSQFDQVLPRYVVQEPRSDHRAGRVQLGPAGKGGEAGFSKSRGIYVAGDFLLREAFAVPGDLQQETLAAFPWMVPMLPLGMVAGVATGTLEFRKRFLLANLLQAAGTTLGQTLPLGCADIFDHMPVV